MQYKYSCLKCEDSGYYTSLAGKQHKCIHCSYFAKHPDRRVILPQHDQENNFVTVVAEILVDNLPEIEEDSTQAVSEDANKPTKILPFRRK